MKRFIVAMTMAASLIPGISQADFQTKVQGEVQKEIGAFFQRNQGSVITIDNMDGLMLHLHQVFNENIAVPKPVPAPDAPTEDKDSRE